MNPYSNRPDDELIWLAAQPGVGGMLAMELAERYQRLRDCIRQAIDRLENNPPPKQGARHES